MRKLLITALFVSAVMAADRSFACKGKVVGKTYSANFHGSIENSRTTFWQCPVRVDRVQSGKLILSGHCASSKGEWIPLDGAISVTRRTNSECRVTGVKLGFWSWEVKVKGGKINPSYLKLRLAGSRRLEGWR